MVYFSVELVFLLLFFGAELESFFHLVDLTAIFFNFILKLWEIVGVFLADVEHLDLELREIVFKSLKLLVFVSLLFHL